MKKRIVHLQSISLLVLQIWMVVLTIAPLTIVPSYLLGTGKIIFVVILSSLLIVQTILIPLSLCFFWNTPLLFDSEGISKKIKGEYVKFYWSDVSSVKTIAKWPGSGSGPRYVRVAIRFLNGFEIRFEPTTIAIKDIKTICNNDHFLEMFNEMLKE